MYIAAADVLTYRFPTFMDSSKIKTLIFGVIAVLGLLYLGISAATAQFETIAWTMGGVTLSICFLLGRRIWFLIPFLGALGLSFRLPGQPTTMLIAQLLTIGFSTLILLMRRLPYRLRFTELEFWALILTLCVAQVYARNPTGFLLFGGDSVGGKPYFIFAIYLLTAILLSGLLVPPGELKWILRLSILGGILNFCVSTIGRFVPQVGYILGATYEDTSQPDYSDFGQQVDTGAANRERFLGNFGKNLSIWISSFKSPLMACFRPSLAPLILISIVAAGMSGYRNTVAAVGLTYLVGLCYRGGLSHLVPSLMAGGFVLACIAILNLISPLPPNIQRSLSFLPGTWEKRYLDDAEGSTEWRVELWKEALGSERWISNKLLGDGLGISMRELQYQMNRDTRAAGPSTSGLTAHQEAVLASGDYHSGPVQTIRTIGYMGLAVVLLFQIRLAVHAHRQIKRCRGTEWMPLSLFIGIPLIWAPVFFFFIFGTFASASAALLLGTAMVRLLENNLPLPAYVHLRREPYLLEQRKLDRR